MPFLPVAELSFGDPGGKWQVLVPAVTKAAD